MPTKSLRNLDLNLIVVFEAIYASGNISHAATNLGMTQPAVSNALSRLRALLDDPVFVRAKRGVEPTQKARRMIGPVRDALRLIGAQIAPDELDPMSYERAFRIIVSDALEPIVMPPVVRAIIDTMPKVSVECVSEYRIDFVDEIIEGTIDLACYTYPVMRPGLVTEPLCPADAVVVARRGHPAFRKPISVAAFEALGHIMLTPDLRNISHVEQSMAAVRARRRCVYVVSKFWSFPPMIERTDLVGILPRWFAEEAARNFAVEIHDSPVKLAEQNFHMTWHVRSTDDPGHRWLRESVMAAVRSRGAKPKVHRGRAIAQARGS